MATYSITSDETFLRCTGVGVLELYELDNLYIAPAKRKYWTPLETIHIGVGKQYAALKIGNKEIRGNRLKSALQDLYDSRLMVNREGLCFLPSSEGVSSDGRGCKIEYYRIFDRFDWEKYGAKAPMSTKWVCRDVLQGRPLVSHIDDDNKSKELEEEKRRHEIKIRDLKSKHEDEVEKEQRNNEAKLAELEGQMRAELEKKEEELKVEKQSIAEMKEELTRCDKTMMKCVIETQNVERARVAVSSSIFRFGRGPYYPIIIPRNRPKITACHATCIMRKETAPVGEDGIVIPYIGDVKPSIDLENWWAVSVHTMYGGLVHQHGYLSCVYYEGSYDTIECSDSTSIHQVPIPVQRNDFPKLESHFFLHIAGVGTRFAISHPGLIMDEDDCGMIRLGLV